MTTLETIDLTEAWDGTSVAVADNSLGDRRNRFLRNVGRRCNMTMPQMRAAVLFCCDCAYPTLTGETRPTVDNDVVCESCRDNGDWFCCPDCQRWEVYGNSQRPGDTSICEDCYNNNWFWCDQCEQSWRNDSGHDHLAENNCCISPQMQFAVRRGEDAVGNDERFSLTLDGGVVNDAGRAAIDHQLRMFAAHIPVDPDGTVTTRQHLYEVRVNMADLVGWTWEGERGNLTTRLKRVLYNRGKIKIPLDVLTEIGNIARAHMTGGDFTLAFTRDVNLHASEFFHDGSCWWTDYNYSRCTLKSNGGFGIRTFNGPTVMGRAWVFPLKVNPNGRQERALVPTFETLNPVAYVVFNGYGNLEGHTPAALLAETVGWTYTKIGEFACDRMYINSGSGYIVHPQGMNVYRALYISTSDHSTLFDDEQAQASSTQQENSYAIAG